jgi:hypothetical protein
MGVIDDDQIVTPGQIFQGIGLEVLQQPRIPGNSDVGV